MTVGLIFHHVSPRDQIKYIRFGRIILFAEPSLEIHSDFLNSVSLFNVKVKQEEN